MNLYRPRVLIRHQVRTRERTISLETESEMQSKVSASTLLFHVNIPHDLGLGFAVDSKN